MKKTKYTNIIVFIFILISSSLFSQPPAWLGGPATNVGGTLQGNVTINGVDAETNDWIAAFTPDGGLAGIAVIGYDPVNMLSFFQLVIYGNEGGTTSLMDDGEDFTLQVWDESTNTFYSVGSPASQIGPWAGNTTFDNIPSPLFIDGVEIDNGFFTFSVDASSILPIELSHFGVEKRSCNQFSLEWTTSLEINNDYFSIQRSIDNTNSFETIHTMEGAGNSVADRKYSFEDKIDLRGSHNIYYRLKQTDFDGKFSMSNLLYARMDCESKEMKVFPNPFNATLEVSVIAEDKSIFTVHDAYGRVIETINITDQNNNLAINTNQWPDGLYFASQCKDGMVLASQKILKQN